MALFGVFLRSVAKVLSPLIVEGLYNDFWQFKNTINSATYTCN